MEMTLGQPPDRNSLGLFLVRRDDDCEGLNNETILIKEDLCFSNSCNLPVASIRMTIWDLEYYYNMYYISINNLGIYIFNLYINLEIL